MQCAIQALVAGLVAQGATTHSRAQRAGRPQEAAPRAVCLRALTKGFPRERVGGERHPSAPRGSGERAAATAPPQGDAVRPYHLGPRPALTGGMGLAFPRVPRAGGTRHGRMGHSRYWPSISHDWSLNTPISHMVAGSTGACGLTATSCRGKRGTLLRWRRRYAVGMRTRQRSGSPITLGIGVGWGGGDTQLAGPRTSPLLHLSPLY